MDAKAKQGLLLGAIAGAVIGIPFSIMTDNWFCLLLIPVAAVMGMAPQLLKPLEDDD